MAFGGAPIDLEKTFDLVADGPHFAAFVDRLRQDLWDPSGHQLFDGVHALRPFSDDGPIHWLHLTVRGHNRALVMRIRTDNLYVEAFAREDQQFSDNSWWEFQGDRGIHRQLIRGSRSLGFTGGYTNGGMGDISQEESRVEIGMRPLDAAITGLATYDGTDYSVARRWLRTIVVTFSEAIRLRNITSRVDADLRSGETTKIEQTLVDLIRNWEKICTCLILGANNPYLEPVLYGKLKIIEVTNNYMACQVVGIVYHNPKKVEKKDKERKNDEKKTLDDLKEKNLHRELRSINSESTGLAFFEFFKVIIIDIEGENPGDLYGTITVDDGITSQVLFRRDRSNIQSVGPGGCAELTGPTRAVWGYDQVVIDLNLMDGDFFPDLSWNDEVSRGQIEWNSYNKPMSEYNKIMERIVKGAYGSAKVCYAVITDAVVANVKVVLTNGDGEKWPDVYGTLTAATTAFDEGKITLFNRSRNGVIKMLAGTEIQLLRNVVVVPLGSLLKVSAKLTDRDSFPDLSPDDEIANGEVEFRPSLEGTERKEITGRYGVGVVTVHVTWSMN